MKKLEYKYIVSIIYVFILFLDRMDLTITNVAMPTFAKDFNIPITETDWIATSFLITLGIVTPASGWLSDKFGSKKIFILANILFTLSSVFCALSWSFKSLICFRIFQGIGSGILVPVGMSMAYRAFKPKDYPKLANYTLIPTLIAPSIAPAIGGLILEILNWHWIFIFHFPIGVISIWMSIFFLKEDPPNIEVSKFDWVGFCLLALSLSSLFYFLSHIGLYGLKNTTSQITGYLACGFFICFILFELRVKAPLINLNFFKLPLFSLSMILQITMQVVYFGSIFLIALYFQSCLGMTPLQSGLSMTGQSLGTICMLFFSSKLFNSYGPKYILIVGFLCIAVTTYSLLLIENSHEILLANVILWTRGLSIGLVNGPLQACAMLDLTKKDTPKGSAIFSVLRQVGISLGVALTSMVLAILFRSSKIPTLSDYQEINTRPAFQMTFLFFAGVACLGALIATTMNNKKILFKLKSL